MSSTIICDYYVKSKKYDGFACFDLDHTIIKPKSGKVFPKDKNDWQFLNSEVVEILEHFYKNNWLIVIFTNQSSIDKKISKVDFIHKIDSISKTLNINIKFIVSTENDYYRKPLPGMWEIVENEFQYLYQSDIFYCGDAYNPNNRKLNASDYKFAFNRAINFVCPELLFINNFDISKLSEVIKSSNKKVSEFEFYKFIPDSISQYNSDLKVLSEFKEKYKYLFIVSPPSSGKSTFCKNNLSDYIRLSKDDYKSFSKYKKDIVTKINNKLVFDNTNQNMKTRNLILEILKNNGVNSSEIGYIIRDIPKEVSQYLNKYRGYITKGESGILPDVAIHSYYKNVENPQNNYIKIGHMITCLSEPNLLF